MIISTTGNTAITVAIHTHIGSWPIDAVRVLQRAVVGCDRGIFAQDLMQRRQRLRRKRPLLLAGIAIDEMEKTRVGAKGEIELFLISRFPPVV